MRLKCKMICTYWILLAILVPFVSCSTLPPSKPISDLGSIAGTWKGAVTTRRGSQPSTLIISNDGKYKSQRESRPPSEGSLTLKDGKAITSRGTVYTLHEGEGKRILTTASPRGASGEYTQVK